MLHLKSFESFSINEELFGEKARVSLPSREELKKLINSAKKNPEFIKAVDNLKAEWNKLPSNVKSDLVDLSKETPDQIKQDLKVESLIIEGSNWKNVASKFFRGLGILSVSAGFIASIISIVKISLSGSGYSELFGTTADNVTTSGMITMLCSIIPIVISVLLDPKDSKL